MRGFVPCLGVVAFVLTVASAASAEPVIIKCKRPCTAIVQAVEQNGGVVTYRYKYVDAIAADVTTTALGAVRGIAELGAVRKDHLILSSRTLLNDQRGAPGWAQVDATSTSPLGEAQIVALASASPNAYTINNTAMNLTSLHGTGTLGQGMKVALIDSGIRPNFPHLSLDGSVIGGESLVPDPLGFSNTANSGHGTFVAGMISGNVVFTVGGELRSAVDDPLRDVRLPDRSDPEPAPDHRLGAAIEPLRAPRFSANWRRARVAHPRRDGTRARVA